MIVVTAKLYSSQVRIATLNVCRVRSGRTRLSIDSFLKNICLQQTFQAYGATTELCEKVSEYHQGIRSLGTATGIPLAQAGSNCEARRLCLY